MAVLIQTDRGLYCPAGDFHVDPWRPVDRAVITHGHADHARPGMAAYLATDLAAPILRQRLGQHIAVDTMSYGETRRIGGATLSFHPAGHVPGSAQVRIEVAGEVWVVSGDYKTEDDGLSTPFAPVRAHVFISECTFGLPVFDWAPQATVAAEINRWWADQAAAGGVAMLAAYSLGKAQRLLSMLDPGIGPILTHGAITAPTEVLRAQGLVLPPTAPAPTGGRAKAPKGALVVAPPSALGGAWARSLAPEGAAAFASGWMALRGIRRRRGTARGFVLSDHADWKGLNAAIAATGAETVLVTHGYTATFRRWLEEKGYRSGVVRTAWEGDGGEDDGGAVLREEAPDTSEGGGA